jgi:hypothetical protein
MLVKRLKFLTVLLWSIIGFVPIVIGNAFYNTFLSPNPPVEYQLPKIAKIIEQESSAADFFGDYTYSAVFLLPQSEVKNLVSKGFDWVTFDFPIGDQPKWKSGKLPSEICNIAVNNQLKDKPDCRIEYKYLFIGALGGYRLFAIEEKKGKVVNTG